MLSQLEGNAGPVFQKLNENPSDKLALSVDEERTLRVFLGLQITRTTIAGERLNDSVDKLTKIAFSRKAEREGIDLSRVKIGYDQPIFPSMQNFLLYATFIEDLPIHLLVNETEFPFATSDNPVVLYNQYCEPVHKIGRIGADCRGLQIFFPISPTRMLLLYDPKIYALSGKQSAGTPIELSDARSLNLLTAVNADKVLLFSDWDSRVELENVVRKAARFSDEERVVVNEFQADDDENRFLVQVAFPTPNVNLRLSFMRIRRRAQSTPPRIRAIEFRTFRGGTSKSSAATTRTFRRVERP